MIPVVLLGLVTALCFVGCVLNTHGFGQPGIGPYETGITNETSLVAFWPLNDPPSMDTSAPVANDLAFHPPGVKPFNGTYTGDFMLQQAGIVLNDVQNNLQVPCASFSGGRVEVPFHVELNAAPFTLECWVQPSWPAADTNIHAVVVTTNLDPTQNTGYALFCDNTNMWSATIGVGPGPGPGFVPTTPAPGSQPVTPGAGTIFYLALTFDGTDLLSLFVSSAGAPFNLTPYAQASLAAQPPGTKFMPSVAPLSLFIGMGRPDLPTSMQFPFNGKIQDVAFYNVPLSALQLQAHFNLANPG
jgi:hypothetical protein